MRQSFFNVILLMKASPIQSSGLRIPGLTSFSSFYTPTTSEVRTTVPSFFRTDLLQSLSEGKKVLHLKFEVLTRSILNDTTKFGCRIMLMQSDMTSPEGVVVETPEGKPELIKYPEFMEMLHKFQTSGPGATQGGLNDSMQIDQPNYRRKVSSSLGDRGIDLFIVGTKNDMNTANFISKELKIPHVVAFNFKRDTEDLQNQDEDVKMRRTDPLSFKRKLYEDECVEKFCGYFFNELIDGCSVQHAFERARKEMIECISFSFFESKDDLVTEMLGEGPVLLPNRDDKGNEILHDDFLFGIDDYVLQGGKVEDISSVRYPSNVHKSLIPFTGRLHEMDELMKILLQPKDNIVLLTGEPGIGKTRFVQEVAYNMLMRNFFPDGIFYFPLRKLKKKNIFEMIKETINSEAFGSKLEYNLKNLFRNKKMLLIFDDIDIFYETDIEFPWLVFSILQKSCIPTVLIQKETTKSSSSVNTLDKKLQKKADLQKKINDDLIKETLRLERFTDIETAHILISLLEQNVKLNLTPTEAATLPSIRAVKGNPFKLIKLLNEDKIVWEGETLKLNPVYTEFMNRKSGARARMRKIPHWTGGDEEEDPSAGLILTFSRHCSQYHKTMQLTRRKTDTTPTNFASYFGGMTFEVPIPLAEKSIFVDQLEQEYEHHPKNLRRSNMRTRTQKAFEVARSVIQSVQDLEESKTPHRRSKKSKPKIDVKAFESESSDDEVERRKERIMQSRKQSRHKPFRLSAPKSPTEEAGGDDSENATPTLAKKKSWLKSPGPEENVNNLTQDGTAQESGGFSVNDEETQTSDNSSSDSDTNLEKQERVIISTPFLRPKKSIHEVYSSPKINPSTFKKMNEDNMKSPKGHKKTMSLVTGLPMPTMLLRSPSQTHRQISTASQAITAEMQSLYGMKSPRQTANVIMTPTGNGASQNGATNAIIFNFNPQMMKRSQPGLGPIKSPAIRPTQTQMNAITFTPKISAFKMDRTERNEKLEKNLEKFEKFEKLKEAIKSDKPSDKPNRSEKAVLEARKKLLNLGGLEGLQPQQQQQQQQQQPTPSTFAGLAMRKLDRK